MIPDRDVSSWQLKANPSRKWSASVTVLTVIALLSGLWRLIGVEWYREWVAARPEAINPVFRFEGLVGDEVEHTFQIINRGREKAVIDGVGTECGCTTVKAAFEGMSVRPGEILDLPVRISLAEASDAFVKRVFVRFAGDYVPELVLRCEGVVRELWVATPARLEFRPDTREQVVELVPATQVTVRPARVSVNHADLAVDLETTDHGPPWRVVVHQQEVRSSPRMAAGLFVETPTNRTPFIVPIRMLPPSVKAIEDVERPPGS
jgi:hypothetical protein